jgi:VWFA-related protein
MRSKIVFAFACLTVFAQDPVTFKVDRNLVIVNVTVRDKSGKILDNLKQSDFTLLENGKPQPISVFEVEHLAGDSLPKLPADTGKTLIKRDAAAPVNVPAPETAAPVEPPSRKDHRLLALFFDMSSMQPPEQIRAGEAAMKFLREQMTSSDLVEIMTFGTELKVVEEFTNDRDQLMKDITKLRIGDSSELAGLGDTGADPTDDSGSFVADETEYNIFNTDRKLAALESAAKKLAAFPEKKALVYISSGVNKTGVENQSQLKSTINAAVRANVAFYPIDARGFLATPPAGDASTASASGTGVYSSTAQQNLRNTFNDSQETLDSLAAETGGKALLDNNDLTLGIQQAQKDINTYYILGYYSNNDAKDGKYRNIKIQLNPKIEAKLDFRKGYYAAKEFAKLNSSDKEQQLEEALTLGDPITDLPLFLEVDYFRLAKDKYFVPISVKIPGSALDLSKREKTDLDFIGQIRDAKGNLMGGVRDGIQLKFNDADATKLGQRNIEYDTGVTLAPGQYRLRFLARENQTGKMGTFETAFTIPDLGKDPSKVRMSSVVWSSQREPLAAVVGSAGNNKKLLDKHPLVQDGQKLVPSITHVFRENQKLYVYFEVYDPAGDKTPSVAADLSMFRGKAKVFESEPVHATQTIASRPGAVAFQFQMPLTSVKPGEYVCQLNVIDEQARTFAFARAPLVVTR